MPYVKYFESMVEKYMWLMYVILIFSLSDSVIVIGQIIIRICLYHSGIVTTDFLWNFIFTYLDDIVSSLLILYIFIKFNYKNTNYKILQKRWFKIMNLNDKSRAYEKDMIRLWLVFSILSITLSTVILILMLYSITTGIIVFSSDVPVLNILLRIISIVASIVGEIIGIFLYFCHRTYKKILDDKNGENDIK